MEFTTSRYGVSLPQTVVAKLLGESRFIFTRDDGVIKLTNDVTIYSYSFNTYKVVSGMCGIYRKELTFACSRTHFHNLSTTSCFGE